MNDEYKLYLQLFKGKSLKELKAISESSDYSDAARAAAEVLYHTGCDLEELNPMVATDKVTPKRGPRSTSQKEKPKQNNFLIFGRIFRILAFGQLFGWILAGIAVMNIPGFITMALTGVTAFVILFPISAVLTFIGKRRTPA